MQYLTLLLVFGLFGATNLIAQQTSQLANSLFLEAKPSSNAISAGFSKNASVFFSESQHQAKRAACAHNLLQNADFSANGSNWVNEGAAISFITNAAAFQGTTAQLCNVGSRIFQNVPIIAGKNYTLEAVAKSDSDGSGLLVIKYLNSAWIPLVQEYGLTENTNYLSETISKVAPTGAVYAEISVVHNRGSGCVWVDDLCFSEGGGSMATDCGFESCNPTPYLNLFNPIPAVGFETPTGFHHQIGSWDGTNSYTFQHSSLLSNGNFVGNPSTTTKTIAGVGDILVTKAGNHLHVKRNSAAGEVIFTLENVAGTVLWTKTHSLTEPVSTTSTTMHLSEVPSGGFQLVGVFQSGSTNTAVPYSFKIDANGDLVGQQNYTMITGEFFYFMETAAYGQGGASYFYVFNQANRTVQIMKVDGAGNQIWLVNGAGDLVSTRLSGAVESSDGSGLYFGFYSNPFATLRRYNAMTGAVDWEENTENFVPFMPSPSVRSTILMPRLLASDDGGVVGTMQLFNPEGFYAYKVNASGMGDWATDLDVDYALEPILKTSDGGFLFVGSKGMTSTCAVKMTANGALSPACTGSASGPDLELVISADSPNPGRWNHVAITLTLSNTGTETASDVEVVFPAQVDVVFRNQLAYVGHTSSAGTTFNYWLGDWRIGDLAAGESRTATFNGFTQTGDIIDVFAQVKTQSPSDVDSAPNNNTSGIPAEDDEALIRLNEPMPLERTDAKMALALSQINVYPNPASDYLMLDLSDFEGQTVQIRLFDAFGRLLLEKLNVRNTNERMGLESVASGVYTVQVSSESMRPIVQRIVVK